MALEAADPIRQLFGMFRPVVERPQQDVFEADATAGHREVVTAILQQCLVGVGARRGDQLLAQLLIGGMQADREGELSATQPLESQFRQLRQGARHTDGADGDAALSDAQVIVEAADRIKHGGAVEQRFPHAHEHNVGRAAIHGLTHAQHLIDDLVGVEGSLETAFAGGAEPAGHWTTHLAGNADRQALIGGNSNGFDRLTVIGGEQQLGGGVSRHRTVNRSETPDRGARVAQRRPPGLGQHCDLGKRTGSLGIDPIVQLPAAEGRLSLSHSPVFKLGRTAAEQRTAHQTSRPWPSLISTASRAMKPSIAMRPFSFSV